MVPVAEQFLLRVAEAAAPVKAEMHLVAASSYGNAAERMADLFGRRPADGERIVIVVDQLVGFRVKLPRKFAQGEYGRADFLWEHAEEFL